MPNRQNFNYDSSSQGSVINLSLRSEILSFDIRFLSDESRQRLFEIHDCKNIFVNSNGNGDALSHRRMRENENGDEY